MKNAAILFLLLSVSILNQCTKPVGQYIEFNLIPDQNTTFTIEEIPLHYKYSPKIVDSIYYKVGKENYFQSKSEIPKIVYLKSNDFSFPIYLDGKSALKLSYDRTSQDRPIQIEGYKGDFLEIYYDLLKTEKPMREALSREKAKFTKGEHNSYIRILDDIQSNRKSVLLKTPYEFMYWASLGEFYVAQIENISKSKMKPKEAAVNRTQIIESAEKAGFFKIKSLESQRAGIRDFTNAWAHSFGIADSVRKKEKKELLIYDVNRLAYPILNKRREEVVFRITEDRARAYADLFLTAERLGEAPYDEAQKAVLRYVQTYSDNYPDYANFIADLNEQIRRVQPGQNAFDFTFLDINEKPVSMSDFKGKIVYLDFWASWCSPCLEEFPDMKKVFAQIDTSKTVFLSIGLDQDKEVWESSLNRYDLPWINLYGGKEFQNEIFKKYLGGGRTFNKLIGKDGKIERYNDVRASFNLKEIISDLEFAY